MELIIQNIDKKYKYTFVAVFIAGIMAHGYMFFNKISFHDDVHCLFSLGSTVELGRWLLEIIRRILNGIVGKYSMPLWTGMVSLLFIALSASMVIGLLEIKETLHCVLIGMIMVVFPAVTGTFIFMFTAGCYFFGLFLIVLSVWTMIRYGIKGGGD